MSIVNLPGELLSRVIGRQVGKVGVVNVMIHFDPSVIFDAHINFGIEGVDDARSLSDLAAMKDALDALRLVNGALVQASQQVFSKFGFERQDNTFLTPKGAPVLVSNLPEKDSFFVRNLSNRPPQLFLYHSYSISQDSISKGLGESHMEIKEKIVDDMKAIIKDATIGVGFDRVKMEIIRDINATYGSWWDLEILVTVKTNVSNFRPVARMFKHLPPYDADAADGQVREIRYDTRFEALVTSGG